MATNIPEGYVAIPPANNPREQRNATPNTGYEGSPPPEEIPRRAISPQPAVARPRSNTQSSIQTESSTTGGWTEEEAENWLEASGNKLMRYYHRTQGQMKFKLRKDKSKISKPLGTGSSDCAPMIHPEEIKITVFEYPDPEDGEYKRGPVRHVQSINPFLTATNMLDALKLAIGGDPKIAAHNAELVSAEKEVTRLTKKVESLVKKIQDIENKISGKQNKNIGEAGNVAPIIPGSTKKAPGGIAYTLQKGGFPIPGTKKSSDSEKPKQSNMTKLREQLANAKKELAATELALKDAEKHLEELQSKVVKGSKAKTVSTPVPPTTNPSTVAENKSKAVSTNPSTPPTKNPNSNDKPQTASVNTSEPKPSARNQIKKYRNSAKSRFEASKSKQ